MKVRILPGDPLQGAEACKRSAQRARGERSPSGRTRVSSNPSPPSRSTPPPPPRSRAASETTRAPSARLPSRAYAAPRSVSPRAAQRRGDRSARYRSSASSTLSPLEFHRPVQRLMRDLREARGLEDPAHARGVAEGERSRRVGRAAAAETRRAARRRARAPSSTGSASRGCQHTKARRPPGRSARRRFAKAATGSAKNITPKREKTRSKRPGAEVGDLRVVESERDAVLEPRAARALRGALQHRTRDVDRRDRAPGADRLRQLQRRAAAAATDVEHALAGANRRALARQRAERTRSARRVSAAARPRRAPALSFQY